MHLKYNTVNDENITTISTMLHQGDRRTFNRRAIVYCLKFKSPYLSVSIVRPMFTVKYFINHSYIHDYRAVFDKYKVYTNITSGSSGGMFFREKHVIVKIKVNNYKVSPFFNICSIDFLPGQYEDPNNILCLEPLMEISNN